MEERILPLEEEISIERLVTRVNEIVGDKFAILDKKDDIEKWNGVPKLLLLNDKYQKRILEFVEFMDSLLIPVEEKAMYIVSLSGLIEFCKLKIENYDNGSLFTMADYYQNSSIEEMKQTFLIIGNKDLLFAARQETLELDTRKKILLDIVNKFLGAKIDTANKEKISSFIQNEINELIEKDYYEVVKE